MECALNRHRYMLFQCKHMDGLHLVPRFRNGVPSQKEKMNMNGVFLEKTRAILGNPRIIICEL